MIMAAVPGQKLVHCNNKYKNTGHQGMQRHHRGHKRAHRNSWRSFIKRCLPMVLTGGMLCTTALTPKYYFDSMLETTKWYATTDLSRFSKKYAQLPWTIRLISGWIKRRFHRKITFTANAEPSAATAGCRTRELALRGELVDEIRRWLKKMTIAWSTRLNKSIPGTAAEFDFNHQRLNFEHSPNCTVPWCKMLRLPSR